MHVSWSAIERGFNTNADMDADSQTDGSSFNGSTHGTWSHAILWSASSWYETKKELCQSVGKLRQWYQEYAEEQKKQRFLTATIESLFKDADKYALDAA